MLSTKGLFMKVFTMLFITLSFNAMAASVPELQNNFCRPIVGSKRYLTSDFSTKYPKKVRFDCSYECQANNKISTIVAVSNISVSSMDDDAVDVVCQGVKVKKVSWGYDFDGSEIFYGFDTNLIELKRWAFDSINKDQLANKEEYNHLIKLKSELYTIAGAYAVAGNNGGEATRGFAEAAVTLTNIANQLPLKTDLLDEAIKQLIVNRGVITLDASAPSLVQRMLLTSASWKIPTHLF